MIRRYLVLRFSEKEVDQFLEWLAWFERTVAASPRLFPALLAKRGYRRAVLTELLSVVYRIRKNDIEIIAVLDNRTNWSSKY